MYLSQNRFRYRTRFRFNSDIYTKNRFRFDCVNKCGGFDSPGCVNHPCNECLWNAATMKEDLCVKGLDTPRPGPNSTPSRDPTPRCCQLGHLDDVSRLRGSLATVFSQQAIHNEGMLLSFVFLVFRAVPTVTYHVYAYGDICKPRDDCSTFDMSVS